MLRVVPALVDSLPRFTGAVIVPVSIRPIGTPLAERCTGFPAGMRYVTRFTGSRCSLTFTHFVVRSAMHRCGAQSSSVTLTQRSVMIEPKPTSLRHVTRLMRPQVSEEQVLQAFSGCGAVVDSRMCGDPNSALRFAFIEFDGEEAVTKARPAWRRGLHALR